MKKNYFCKESLLGNCKRDKFGCIFTDKGWPVDGTYKINNVKYTSKNISTFAGTICYTKEVTLIIAEDSFQAMVGAYADD